MKPVSFLQTDPKWSGQSYAVKGEQATIGNAGCGPAAVAMVVASLKDKSVTPSTTASWMLSHGYKAYKSGTYYTGITACLKAYGIGCRQLNQINNYHHKDQQKLRDSVKNHLLNGHWIIACMGPGTWTRSGHFVLAWGAGSGIVYINDPASTKQSRTAGNLSTFLTEAKYFWLIETEAPEEPTKEEAKGMTENDIRHLIDETLSVRLKGPNSIGTEALQEEHAEAVRLGITDGSRPLGYATREEVAAMVVRAIRILKGGDLP